MSSITVCYKQEINKAGSLTEDFPWENPKVYATWLAQTYFYVCHSTRLLCLAGAHLPLAMQKSHLRFLDHMKEERSHEILAERDMKALGLEVQGFKEFSLTSAFYQSQYFRVQHHSPFALFGYIIFLEGVAAELGPRVFPRLEKAHGAKAASFVKVHAQEDQTHIVSALNELESMPSQLQPLVVDNLRFSADLYARIMSQCVEEAAR